MKGSSSHSTTADTTQAVDEFMSTLDPRKKTEIQALRSLILGVDPRIAEGIKWKAPSFRTTEYFATTNLREKNGIGIILHLGAKVRMLADEGLQVEDPKGLLRWLAPDRAMIVFDDLADLEAKADAFEDIVRRWITYV